MNQVPENAQVPETAPAPEAPKCQCQRKSNPYLYLAGFCVFLVIVGVALQGFVPPADFVASLRKIWFSPAGLITDYVEMAGPAAAFVNAALVTAISLLYIWAINAPINGIAVGTTGIMAGFALFGKNVFNMLPILLGGMLYSKISKKDPAVTCCTSLMASCLGPIVSFVAFGTSLGTGILSIVLAYIAGLLVGIIVPYFAEHTLVFQHGMNLYNTGFTCGFLALFFTAFAAALNQQSTIVSIWGNSYSMQLGIICAAVSVIFVACGLFVCGKRPNEAFAEYSSLLNKKADDFFIKEGVAPTLINMGINGLIVCAILTIIKGDFNGPTLAGIFSVWGFSAKGKHMFNTIPLYIGVLLAALAFPNIAANAASVQLAVLFITACAPLVSEFGFAAGLAAGIFHCFLVQKTGGITGGFNLYNNGFCAGLVCCLLYPLCMEIRRIKDEYKAKKAAEAEIAAEAEALEEEVSPEAENPVDTAE